MDFRCLYSHHKEQWCISTLHTDIAVVTQQRLSAFNVSLNDTIQKAKQVFNREAKGIMSLFIRYHYVHRMYTHISSHHTTIDSLFSVYNDYRAKFRSEETLLGKLVRYLKFVGKTDFLRELLFCDKCPEDFAEDECTVDEWICSYFTAHASDCEELFKKILFKYAHHAERISIQLQIRNAHTHTCTHALAHLCIYENDYVLYLNKYVVYK